MQDSKKDGMAIWITGISSQNNYAKLWKKYKDGVSEFKPVSDYGRIKIRFL